MITVAALAPSLDITYVVDELELGEIHRPLEVVRCAGGKPLNLARASATLDADVEVVAVLGGATGRILHAALTEAGIRTHDVPTEAETRTCVSIASERSRTLTEVYEYAAPIPGEVWREVVAAVEVAVSRRPGWLALAGGPPRELAAEALADLVRTGLRAGCRVAVDTHGSALPAAVDAGPDLVKVNRHEAAELLDLPPDTDLEQLAEAIRARSGGLVVLTDAQLGALAVDDGERWIARLPDVRGHYPVGSGDSFLAGLLSELDRGAPLAEALRTATAAGAANALVPGPGRFAASSVDELRSRVRLDQI